MFQKMDLPSSSGKKRGDAYTAGAGRPIGHSSVYEIQHNSCLTLFLSEDEGMSSFEAQRFHYIKTTNNAQEVGYFKNYRGHISHHNGLKI
jgi:hypothetical protein